MNRVAAGGVDLAALPVAVLALSADLRIVMANQGLGELVGRDPRTLVGSPLDVLLSAASRILFQTHVYPSLSSAGRVEEVFLTLRGPGGDGIPVLLNAVKSPGRDGSEYQIVAVRILARARWEQELLAATRELDRARGASERLTSELSQAIEDLTARHAEERRNHEFRDAFIGVVSHELRTPITTIFGMSHVLRSHFPSMKPAAIAAHLDDIVAEADRLRRLTEDLLVLSRAEGRQLTVAREPILLEHLVRRVVDQERQRTVGRPIHLASARDVPLVLGEDGYIEQVLRNLISNAMKYSPAGSPLDVELGRLDDGATVRVIDSGPGLPAGDPDRLFKVFHREPEAVQQTAGAGIGLFVCRALISAMGGRIWASGAPPPRERGAAFGFWLPSAPDEGLEDGS